MSLYDFTPGVIQYDVDNGIFYLIEIDLHNVYTINFFMKDDGKYTFTIAINEITKFLFDFDVNDYEKDMYKEEDAVINIIPHNPIPCDDGIERNYCYNSYINSANNNIIEIIEFRILDHNFLHESLRDSITKEIFIRKLTVIASNDSTKSIYIHKYSGFDTVSGLNDNTANIFLNFYYNFYLKDVKFIHDTIVTGAIGAIASDTGLFTITTFTEPYHFIRQYFFLSSQNNPLILEVILLETPDSNKNTASKYIYAINLRMDIFFSLETLINNDDSGKTSKLVSYGERIEYSAKIIQDIEFHFIIQYKFNDSFNLLINLDFSNYTNNKALTTIIRFDKSEFVIGEIEIIDDGTKVTKINPKSYPR